MATLNFQDPKKFSQVQGIPGSGAFAIESVNLDWINCRETFANNIGPNTSGFYFSHNFESDAERIGLFILKFEEIINLNRTNKIWHSKFSRTNRTYATWIEPSYFWMDCTIKRSLLTALLRASLFLDLSTNNFEQTLFSHEFIQRTKRAVIRFLFGFTRYLADYNFNPGWGFSGTKGWVQTFENRSDETIRKQLLLPLEEPARSTLTGINCIWV